MPASKKTSSEIVKAPLATVVVEKVKKGSVNRNSSEGNGEFSLTPVLDGVTGGDVVRWLERAVPAYERARAHTVLMALAIGYVLTVVRDHSPRGTLTKLKGMEVFGKSESTLKRCMKLAQKFIGDSGLIDEETDKLAKPEQALSLFTGEFELGDSNSLANPLLCTMAKWAGDESMRDLLDDDILGEDETETPTGHQKDAAAKRTKETPEGIKRNAFISAHSDFYASFMAREWECLYLHKEKDAEPGASVGRIDLEKWLKQAHTMVQKHNKSVAAKERAAKAKGGKR